MFIFDQLVVKDIMEVVEREEVQVIVKVKEI